MSTECLSRELTGPQLRALTLLLEGQPTGNVAYECRVTPRTLNNWLQLPHFREALIAGQSRLIEETWTQLANAAAGAIRTLHWISQDTHQKGSVRVAAASKLLDLLFRNAARFTVPAVEGLTAATVAPEQPALAIADEAALAAAAQLDSTVVRYPAAVAVEPPVAEVAPQSVGFAAESRTAFVEEDPAAVVAEPPIADIVSQPAAFAVQQPAVDTPLRLAPDALASLEPATAEQRVPPAAGLQPAAGSISSDPPAPAPRAPRIHAGTTDEEIDTFINTLLARAKAGLPFASTPAPLDAVVEKPQRPPCSPSHGPCPSPQSPPLAAARGLAAVGKRCLHPNGG